MAFPFFQRVGTGYTKPHQVCGKLSRAKIRKFEAEEHISLHTLLSLGGETVRGSLISMLFAEVICATLQSESIATSFAPSSTGVDVTFPPGHRT